MHACPKEQLLRPPRVLLLGIASPHDGTMRLRGSCPLCADRQGPPVDRIALEMGRPDDTFEQEAERVASEVTADLGKVSGRGSRPRIEALKAEETGGANARSDDVDGSLRATGNHLEPKVRLQMEQRFERDFSAVRVHTGSAAARSARDMSASAYTVGNNIVFGSGQYAPEGSRGRRLIAHELTHVVQQSQARRVQRTPEGSSPPKGSGAFDIDFPDLEIAGEALELGAHLLADEPLTAEEMNELLLIRRAEPLSISASAVNEAPEELERMAAKIKALDQKIKETNAEVGNLQGRRKGAKGFAKGMIAREIGKQRLRQRPLRRSETRSCARRSN